MACTHQREKREIETDDRDMGKEERRNVDKNVTIDT